MTASPPSRRAIARMTDGPFYPPRSWRERWSDWDADLTRVQRGARVLQARGELLLRAFENVLRNAVKFTAPGTAVEVQARAEGRWLRVCVADRGPGLPPEALQRIFEPFVRVDAGVHTEGFGLGLAIARRAALAHGGRLEALAREGGGLVLAFSLPLPDGATGSSTEPVEAP